MAEYTTPGVYIEDNPIQAVTNEVSSPATGGFVGITQRGPIDKVVFIESWNAYIQAFANGMDSPFIANSDLAYAVYGFFQNGGKRCYVARVTKDKSAVVASTTSPAVSAKDAGSWGNNISISITENADDEDTFDLVVRLSGVIVESYTGLSNDASSVNYWVDVLSTKSEYIIGSGVLAATQSDTELSGGADGTESIADTDYTAALGRFDSIHDLDLLCIPGQTSSSVVKILLDYCAARDNVFAIIDPPQASTFAEIRNTKKTLVSAQGKDAFIKAALLFPWIKVSDPLSKVGKLRNCPPSGHVMGVYARTFSERGVWKAPAGVDSVVRGAIDTTIEITTKEVGTLNSENIIPIISVPNNGIVVWGAKNLVSSTYMKYVSDVLLDIYIKRNVQELARKFVFEPNNSLTWTRITAEVQSFLDSMWRDGALHGDTANEAYYVKCDSELNDAAARNAGKILCEVGYANNKPAEFIVFKFSHEVFG